MHKNKPEVGQVVYSLNIGNRARRCESKLTPVNVTKVGSKYFYAMEVDMKWTEIKYHISNWREVTEYSAGSKLYETEQSYSDEVEANEVFKRISPSFNNYSNVKGLTLDQLNRIESIIGEQHA